MENLDDLLCRLLCVGSKGKGLTKDIKESELMTLCIKVREVCFSLFFAMDLIFFLYLGIFISTNAYRN